MKRISIFIRSLSRGGAEKQSLLLAKCLNPYYEVNVLSFYPNNQYEQFILDNNIHVIFLQGSFLNKLVFLYKYFKKEKETAIFNYLPINNIFGTLTGKLAGVKHIYCGIRNADYVTEYYKLILQKMICNNFSKYIITNSFESLLKYGEAGFRADKIKVIHNCIEIPDILPVKNINETFIVLTVTRFVDFKDIGTAIKAVHFLVNKYPQWRKKIKYYLVGYGSLEQNLKLQVKNLKLNDVIEIYDGNRDVTNYYLKANTYLSTSLSEGLSNSIMEAMIYSLPVVATNAGDNRFLVKDGENGFLCDTKDYKSIGESIFKIISNEEIHRKFGEMSLKIIKESFSTDAFTRNYLELINR